MFASRRVVTNIVDLGPPADWVKISVRETVSAFYSLFQLSIPSTVNCIGPYYLHCLYAQKDCFEVYALVPGLLREEVSPCETIFVLPLYSPLLCVDLYRNYMSISPLNLVCQFILAQLQWLICTQKYTDIATLPHIISYFSLLSVKMLHSPTNDSFFECKLVSLRLT